MPNKPIAPKTSPKNLKKPAKPTVQARLRWFDMLAAILTVSLISYGLWQIADKDQVVSREDCAEIGQEHQVTLKADAFNPSSIIISRCDRLVISNQGTEAYDLAFGTHSEHIEYPGFARQILRQGEYFTLDALKTGTFPLHDHSRDRAKLQLTVTP